MSNNGGWWQPPTPPGRPPGPPPYGMPPGGMPPGGWGPAGPGPMGPGGPGPWGQIPLAPKPGVIPLRPLAVGEITSGIFTTIRYNLGSVYGPPLITGLAGLLLIAAWGLVEWSSLYTFWADANSNVDNNAWSPSGSEVTGFLIAIGVFFLLAILVYLAVYISASLSGVATLRHAVVGRRVKMAQTAREGSSSLWRLVGATLLAQLLGAAPMIAVILVFGTLGVLTNGASLVVFFGILGYLAAIAAAIYVQVRLVPLSATVILEGKRPVEAIKRAWRLNEGAWWRSLGITLLVWLIGVAIQYGVSQVLSLFFVGATGFTTGPTTNSPATSHQFLLSVLVLYAVLVPVSLLVNLMTVPLIPMAHGLLYIDLRIRRESLDIQLAEEAGIPFAGTAPPAAPQPGPHPGPQPPQDDIPPPPAAPDTTP